MRVGEVAGGLGSNAFRVPAGTDLVEWYYEQGWTDGLPIVPPTPEKVAAMVRALGERQSMPLAARPASIAGLRVGVLDNGKWNAGRLLDRTIELLPEAGGFRRYKKDGFSHSATPELIARIAAENDLALVAIGD